MPRATQNTGIGKLGRAPALPLVLALAAGPALAQTAGLPDPTFGGDGVVIEQLSPSPSGDHAYAR